MQAKTHIVLHHSLTEDGVTISMPVIRKNHEALGYRDIGYHLIIEWIERSGTDGHFEAMLGRSMFDRAAAASR